MNELYKGNCFDILPTLEIGDNAVIVTDPPFNIGYHYMTYKDKMKEEQYLDELKSVINRTGVACKRLGYDFIGIELDEEYYREAEKRIESQQENFLGKVLTSIKLSL